MQIDSLAQIYSSKTDDDLLVLATQQGHLTEEAKSVLADELRRRNLDESATIQNCDPSVPTPRRLVRALVAIKWLGLWLLNTFIATLGVAMAIGFLTYSSQPFVSRAARLRLVLKFLCTPYSPILIVGALVIGYFSYMSFRGSYRYWVWVIPAAGVLNFLLAWKESHQASWSNSLMHFFGFLPFPENKDQMDSTLFLYLSLAYSLGALVHESVHHRLKIGSSSS